MTGLKRSDICVVIPAYNEAAHIGPVLRKVIDLGFSVVVSDDGSVDGTASKAREAGATVLESPLNTGKGGAMKRGMEYFLATAQAALVFMDADGQHDPSDLDVFLAALGEGGSALVLGDRMARPQGMPMLRRLTNQGMSRLLSFLSGQPIRDSQCGYRAMTRELASRLRLKTDHFEIESEMLLETARLGFRIGSVPVRCVYGSETSKVNPLRDTLRFLAFLLRYYTRR